MGVRAQRSGFGNFSVQGACEKIFAGLWRSILARPAPSSRARLTARMKTRRLVAGPRHVFAVAAAVLMSALGRQLQHAVRERGKEVPVMRHEQHGALEVLERGD